ncbi:hypothetical protein MHYP_G00062100 [Metynnis hypsauchen]
MFSQSSANIPAALILILLAVLQVKVHCKPAEQRVVKKTCGSPCRSRGNCYYKCSLFTTTVRYSDRITAAACPSLRPISRSFFPSLVNKTPRYLNSSTWGKSFPPTWSRHAILFRAKTMDSDLERRGVLGLPPQQAPTSDPLIHWDKLQLHGRQPGTRAPDDIALKIPRPHKPFRHDKAPIQEGKLKGELGDQQWSVTYTPERVCALKGSSVHFSCTYKHPEGLSVTKSLWYIESHWSLGDEYKDVRQSDQYKGRVQYSRTLNSCRMTITDLRESDTQTYSFRFYTEDPDGKYSSSSGVTLSVTDLKVTVSDTDGGEKKLTCSSTCTLPNNPTYIWYKNGQPVSDQNRNELELRDRTVDPGSYFCAVKGYEELGSPVVCVFDKVLQVKVEGPAATASERRTVTLTCSSTCTLPNNPTYIWYKNGQPVSQCESASCSVAVVSEAVRYCCAVKGSDFHSPLVWSPGPTPGARPGSSAPRRAPGGRAAHELHKVRGAEREWGYSRVPGWRPCSWSQNSPKTTRAVILPSGQRAEGDSVTLTCSSDADPPVLSYSWFNQSSDVELGTGQSYSITNISSQHSGLYYCTAQNQLGQSRSEPSRLDVLYSPRPPSVSETEFDGSVTLVCVSDSNPASSYTWFRKTGGDTTPFGEGASLTLSAGADGVFYCTAENLLGSSTSSGWTLTSAELRKQFAVWGIVELGSALVLSLIIAVLYVRRKRGAERRTDVQAPKSGDETYSALNTNITSPDYDALTPVRDSPSDTYSALNPETRTSDYDALTVVRPHPVMRRAPENEN